MFPNTKFRTVQDGSRRGSHSPLLSTQPRPSRSTAAAKRPHLMKLRWTPRERCTPEQSMHKKTPYVMLAQLGFLAPQSKQAWVEEAMNERSRAPSRGQGLTLQENSPRTPLSLPWSPGGPGESLLAAQDPARFPLTHLVGRNCAKPLKKSLDFGLTRLRRHFLSFPDTSATDGPRQGPIRGREGRVPTSALATPTQAEGWGHLSRAGPMSSRRNIRRDVSLPCPTIVS